MAANWQYAALTKGERLDKIRSGDKEVYAQEKARINTLINSYKELGLDTAEQEEWARSLDKAATNNYGKGGSVSTEEKLYNNARLGSGEISSYTSIYPSNKAQEEKARGAGQSQTVSSVVYSSPDSQDYDKTASLAKAQGLLNGAYGARQSALDSYYKQLNAQAEDEYSGKKKEAFAYAMNRLPAIREGLANAGLHSEGGASRSEQLRYQAGLDNALSALDSQKASVISGNNRAKENESAVLYSDYVKSLTSEQARLDELYYKISRDAQDDAYRKAQLVQQQEQYERDAQSSDARTAAEYAQWQKEFSLKSDAQQYSQARTTALDQSEKEQFEKEYDLKLRQANEALSQWEKEYGLKQSQWEKEYGLKQSQAELSKQNADKEYEYKNAQLQAQREQALREYTLKKMAQDQSVSQAQRSYAMELLENSQSQESWQAELEQKRQSEQAKEEKSDESASKAGQSAPETIKQADTPAARSDSYDAFLDTARWMKSAVTGKGGSSQRQFTDKQIADWVSSLPVSSRQRRDIMASIGLSG